MKGIQYVIDDKGNRIAVQIDLKKHKTLWEDFCDYTIANSRKNEERVSLDSVMKKINTSSKKKG